MSTLSDLLRPDDILLDVAVETRRELIDLIGSHMARVHALSHLWVVRSLEQREKIGSTALGQGVAIPHARIKGLDRIQVAYLRLKPAIPFSAPDGQPVSDIFVLLVPHQATEDHLLLLSETSQLFSERRFRDRLHHCADSTAVKQLFATWTKDPL